MFYPEIIGYIAGVLTTIAFFPQVIKIYKSNQTNDLSLITFIIFFIGILSWLIYGFLINSKPLIITNLIQLNLILYIIYKIILHSKLYNL